MAITEKTAYVLFGGIGSGKTTLAHNIEFHDGAFVISTDRLIYQKDLLARSGIAFNSYEERSRIITRGKHPVIVLDELAQPVNLLPLRQAGYTIVAVFIDISKEERSRRFQERRHRQSQIVDRLSEICGFDLGRIGAKERRSFFSDETFFGTISRKESEEFSALLKEGYHLGGLSFDSRHPDPLDFDLIDFTVRLTEEDDLRKMRLTDLEKRRVPQKRYRKERLREPIKLCVWDAGNVLYRFDLGPLLRLTIASSRSPTLVEKRQGSFTFRPYMSGEIDFSTFCRRLCDHYDISYTASFEGSVAAALKQGVGEAFEVSHYVMSEFRRKGIKNALLSNALPVISEGGVPKDLIPSEARFYSYEIGHLKPDKKSYLHVLETLGVPPEDALFVDDKLENILAAIDFGISSIAFYPGSFLRDLSIQLPFSASFALGEGNIECERLTKLLKRTPNGAA